MPPSDGDCSRTDGLRYYGSFHPRTAEGGPLKYRAAAVVLLTTLATVVVAQDVFQEYRLNKESWTDSLLESMTSKEFSTPQVPRALKAVAPAQRAAIVTALAEAGRAFVESPAFATRYAEYFAKLPDSRRTPKTAKELADSMKADFTNMLTQMEEVVKNAPPDQKKQAEAAYAATKKDLAEQMKAIDQMAAMAAQEARREAKNNPEAATPDPAATMKKALRRFLSQTADVDFAAATARRGSLQKFVRDDYEAKPQAWKMCYRAGQEACDAARAFATSWAAAIK